MIEMTRNNYNAISNEIERFCHHQCRSHYKDIESALCALKEAWQALVFKEGCTAGEFQRLSIEAIEHSIQHDLKYYRAQETLRGCCGMLNQWLQDATNLIE